MRNYTNIAFTPSVQAVQTEHGTKRTADRMAAMPFEDDRLSERESTFIAARDSFFLASVGDNGWPYVQHRGGPVGFVKVLDPTTLAFADYRGNRQYITQGHVSVDDRVALFLIDHPARRRLKLYARAEVRTVDEDPELAARVIDDDYGADVDRLVLLRVEAFDWNCPQHITPRWTAEEIAPQVRALTDRIAALEAENAGLKHELSHHTSTCD